MSKTHLTQILKKINSMVNKISSGINSNDNMELEIEDLIKSCSSLKACYNEIGKQPTLLESVKSNIPSDGFYYVITPGSEDIAKEIFGESRLISIPVPAPIIPAPTGVFSNLKDWIFHDSCNSYIPTFEILSNNLEAKIALANAYSSKLIPTVTQIRNTLNIDLSVSDFQLHMLIFATLKSCVNNDLLITESKKILKENPIGNRQLIISKLNEFNTKTISTFLIETVEKVTSAINILKTMNVYVLQLEFYKCYVGITNNMSRRYKEHKSGRGSEFTKTYKPLSIIHHTNCSKMLFYLLQNNPYNLPTPHSCETFITLVTMGICGIQNVQGAQYVGKKHINCKYSYIQGLEWNFKMSSVDIFRNFVAIK